MNYENEAFFNVNRFPVGVRIFVVGQMSKAAKAAGLPADVVTRCDRCIAADRAHMAHFKAYVTSQAQASTAAWSPEILEIDSRMDPLVVDLRDSLSVQARRPHTPKGAASKELLDAHFSMPATWYTHVAIEDGCERVGLLLAELAADPARVAAAEVGEIIAELVPLHTSLAEHIEAHEKTKPIAFESIRQGDLEGHRALLGLVGHVLHLTNDLPTEARLAQRQALLAPVLEKNAEITAAIRARRRVVDVNPDSGLPEG